ncbi:CLUMA_CG021622, isoform A [Clunio marinus]|uniref:CLUMA_CG021622, isoform A n=1 Tax=Clunio marinus TaxID=568069 RepID=A0A1J1J7V0_9DIPT|nr:CLUMA_CG021622, isoform A [Clunio marinus]
MVMERLCSSICAFYEQDRNVIMIVLMLKEAFVCEANIIFNVQIQQKKAFQMLPRRFQTKSYKDHWITHKKTMAGQGKLR